MERFVMEQNIRRYRNLLETTRDGRERAILQRLLAAEEENLKLSSKQQQ